MLGSLVVMLAGGCGDATPPPTIPGGRGGPSIVGQASDPATGAPVSDAGVDSSSAETGEAGADQLIDAKVDVRASECVSACDCPALTGCIDGRCEPSAEGGYCCDRAPCPSGAVCDNPGGTRGVCL
jgi:hypothetical protein